MVEGDIVQRVRAARGVEEVIGHHRVELRPPQVEPSPPAGEVQRLQVVRALGHARILQEGAEHRERHRALLGIPHVNAIIHPEPQAGQLGELARILPQVQLLLRFRGGMRAAISDRRERQRHAPSGTRPRHQPLQIRGGRQRCARTGAAGLLLSSTDCAGWNSSASGSSRLQAVRLLTAPRLEAASSSTSVTIVEARDSQNTRQQPAGLAIRSRYSSRTRRSSATHSVVA